METKNRAQASRHKLAKKLLAVMALGTLGTGFILYMFAEDLGIASDTAEVIAIAFLAAGIMDYLLLVMWDRIFARD